MDRDCLQPCHQLARRAIPPPPPRHLSMVVSELCWIHVQQRRLPSTTYAVVELLRRLCRSPAHQRQFPTAAGLAIWPPQACALDGRCHVELLLLLSASKTRLHLLPPCLLLSNEQLMHVDRFGHCLSLLALPLALDFKWPGPRGHQRWCTPAARTTTPELDLLLRNCVLRATGRSGEGLAEM